MTTQPELPFDEYGSEETVAVTEVAPDIELDAPITEVWPPVVEPRHISYSRRTRNYFCSSCYTSDYRHP